MNFKANYFSLKETAGMCLTESQLRVRKGDIEKALYFQGQAIESLFKALNNVASQVLFGRRRKYGKKR